jgi:hypothetical protein
MNTRERVLLIILVGTMLLLGGGISAQFLLVKPYLDARDRVKKASAELEKKKGELDQVRRRNAELFEGDPRLAQWRRLSMPQSPKNDPKEAEKHQEKMQEEYRRYLSEVLAESGFRDPRANATAGAGPIITPEPPESKSAPETTAGSKTPLYTRFAYKVDANAEYDGVRRALEKIDRTPLLHAVRKLAVTRSTTRPGSLDVKMTVEVLMVNGAAKRDTLMPQRRWFTPPWPVTLAKPDRNYADMVAKNMWTGVNSGGARVTEDPREVLEHVKLTMIHWEQEPPLFAKSYPQERWVRARWFKPPYWEARLYDQGKGGDEISLGVSPNPRVVVTRVAGGERGRKEQRNQFVIRDRNDNVVFAGEVVGVNSQGLYFVEKGQGRIYYLAVGDVVYNAVGEPPRRNPFGFEPPGTEGASPEASQSAVRGPLLSYPLIAGGGVMVPRQRSETGPAPTYTVPFSLSPPNPFAGRER